MGVDLLSRLSGVRSTGRDRWIAKCPAHDDRSPSMTVRQLPDGRTLMYCFAGCETAAILDALGLTFSDLFPEPLTRESLPRTRGGIGAHEALACLRSESAVLAIMDPYGNDAALAFGQLVFFVFHDTKLAGGSDGSVGHSVRHGVGHGAGIGRRIRRVGVTGLQPGGTLAAAQAAPAPPR